MTFGSLRERLESDKGRALLSPVTRIKVVSDVVRALTYLHGQKPPILHLGVTSDNVLLDRGLVARLHNFGVAPVQPDPCKTASAIGSRRASSALLYMAPEHKNGEISSKSDSFSLGLLMLETLTGLSVLEPVAGCANLLRLWEDSISTSHQLQGRLDPLAGEWAAGGRVHLTPRLGYMIGQCLELRARSRVEVADLAPDLAQLHAEFEHAAPMATADAFSDAAALSSAEPSAVRRAQPRATAAQAADPAAGE